MRTTTPHAVRTVAAISRLTSGTVSGIIPGFTGYEPFEANALLWLIIDLEFGSRVGDEDD